METAWEKKKKLKVGEEKRKGLLRLNGRDGEFKKASKTLAMESKKAWE